MIVYMIIGMYGEGEIPSPGEKVPSVSEAEEEFGR